MDRYTRLYLIRHGQVENYESGVLNGHNNVGLSTLGLRQLETVASRLKDDDIAAVYSSDLQRARKGAEFIARHHGLMPVVDASLRELNFGLWTGASFMEIEAAFPGALEERSQQLADYRPPGGESLGDLQGRVMPVLRKALADHAGAVIVFVAHGGVNRVILADALGLDPDNFYSIEQDYGCVNIVDYFSDLAVVKLMNGRVDRDF